MKILRATEQLGQEVYSLDELYPMSDITDGLDISMLDKSLSNGMIFPPHSLSCDSIAVAY